MNRKHSSSTPRTPNIRKPNLPHLNKMRGYSETPNSLKSDLNTYSLIQDNSLSLNQGRRFFTPTNIARTAIPSSFRIDTECKEEYPIKPVNESIYWEVKERTESYEMRIKTDYSNLSKEFYLWTQCCYEIIPLIKQKNPDLGEIFSKVSGKLINLFKDQDKENQDFQKKAKTESQVFKKKIKDYEEEIKSLKSLIESMNNSERLEKEQIEREINELFGTEETEKLLIKMRPKLNKESPLSTAEYLKEVYNQMNKEYLLPDKKAINVPSFNPGEFEQAMHKKFRLIQKTTAFKIMKVMEGKNKEPAATQTTAAYVSPKEFEDISVSLEKMNIQYQSAIQQIERYREEISNKTYSCESMENEKVNLISENARWKRDFESLSKELSAVKTEINLLKTDQTKTQPTRSQQVTESENLVTNLNSKITSLNKKIESLTSKTKEQEDLITSLQEKLLGKIDSKGEPLFSVKKSYDKLKASKESSNLEEQSKSKNSPVLDSQELKKSKNSRKAKNSGLSDSQSTVKDQSEDHDQIYSLKVKQEEDYFQEPISSKSSYQYLDPARPDSKISYIQDTKSPLSFVNDSRSTFHDRSSNNTPAEKNKQLTEGSLPTRVNSRDTPLSRVDETKEFKGRNTRENPQKTEKNDSQKRLKKTEKPKNLNRHESEDEYQINRPVQWENLISKAMRSEGFDQGEEKVIIGKDGREYKVCEKGVWTTDELKLIQVTNFSKGVQVTNGSPIDQVDSKASLSRGIYFLPYNPNNAYGLRGETYFSTKQQVFSAQPRIPDLSNSILYQQSYYLDKT